MGTITLENVRATSDITTRVRLKDGGLAIDWSGMSEIKAWIFSDAQKALAGRCVVSVDQEDDTLLLCEYAATKPQYLGVNRIVVQCRYNGRLKTYDKPAFNLVARTAELAGDQIVLDDPVVDVAIEVQDVSSSILDTILAACIKATEEAQAMIDMHRGLPGKSAYQVAVDNGFEGTEDEWLASLVGDDGKSAYELAVQEGYVGTLSEWLASLVGPQGKSAYQVAVDNGFEGTQEQWLASLVGPQGLSAYQVAVAQGYTGTVNEWLASLVGPVGPTPVFTVGEVTTGQPGTPVVVTITGTAAAPVLNITIPQGMQGNTGSSVDYPYELVNNLTTNDATKGLSAAQGKVLKDEITQLDLKLYGSTVETLLPSQAYSEINFDTTWGGNTDNIYYDTRLLISPTARLKKVSIFRQATGTLKVYFIKKSDLSIVTYKEVSMTSSAGFQTFDLTLEDAYYANGEMYVGINGSIYFGAKTGLSPTTSYTLSISTGTSSSNTRSWGILITTESASNGDIVDIEADITALQAEDVVLNGKITDINNILYETKITPSEDWLNGTFSVAGGGDAQYAFLDSRTAIPAGATLDRVRMKAVASKNITIYLLKASDYSVLASTTKAVVSGINDITPSFSASLFSVPTYIAIGSADSPIAMRDTNGTSETSYTDRVTIASGDVSTGRRYIIALEVKYTTIRGNNISSDLQEAITQGGNDIVLGPYDYEVTTPIVLTSGMTIRGSFGKTRLILTDGCQTAITASNANGIKISDLEIVGTCPDYSYEMNGIVAGTGYDLVETEANALALDYMGTEKGIYIYYCENVVIENLRINHIDGSAIRVNHTGMDYIKGLNANNLFITNCYNGIYCENEHEFSQYTNWAITLCMIGVYVASGNLIFTAGHATRCRVAMQFVAGTNHAHGIVNGVELKHNQIAGLLCNAVTYGEFFEGLYLSYSKLIIRDSSGLYFDDIMTGNMHIDSTGTTGKNVISKLVKRNSGVVIDNQETLTIGDTIALY